MVLNRAGWKYIRLEGYHGLFGGVEGVQVYVHPQSSELTKRSANSLVDALNKAEILSVLKEENDPTHPNNRLILNVGTKP